MKSHQGLLCEGAGGCLPQPSANAGVLTAPVPPPGREVIYGCVSGQEMEWKENITAEISLVVQIRHLKRRRHRLFSPQCV